MVVEEARKNDSGGAIGWMAGNHVAANLLMLALLVGGVAGVWKMKQEVIPDIEKDVVEIFVSYPGAAPEDVERGVVLPVEEAVEGLDGVEDVYSTAKEGGGIVRVEIVDGADVQRVYNDVKNAVDRIVSFPEGTEQPRVRLVVRKRGVMDVILYGDAPLKVLYGIARNLKDFLIQDDHITLVEIGGTPPLEVSVEVSQDVMRLYDITHGILARRLERFSRDVPAGELKTPSGHIMLREGGGREYGRDFAVAPVVFGGDGGEVPLERIARVRDDFAEEDTYLLYDGKPAVVLSVYRVGKETPIEVADAVRRRLEMFKQFYPPGIRTAVVRDMSEIYRQRVQLLLRNARWGLILVLVLLGVFLEARVAFWVMMGIPVSFVGSFLLLPWLGVSINMISLFAYIIAIGIVVDDAIVVGENVYHYRRKGVPPLAAAMKGAREVAMPVTFSVLTNMVTFIPLYFVPGTVGKFFRMIPAVIVVVFLISLVESLFILPAHLARTRLDVKRKGFTAWLHARQQSFSAAFQRWVEHRYGAFLDKALEHRVFTVVIAVCLLVLVLSYAVSGRMGFHLFPSVEADFAQAYITLPYGSPVEETRRVAEKVVSAARRVARRIGHPEVVKAVVVHVGPAGSHTASIVVELPPPELRQGIISTTRFVRYWREEVGTVVGVESIKFSSEFAGPRTGNRTVVVQLRHYDVDVLHRAGKELAAALESFPAVRDVDDGSQNGKAQITLRLNAYGRSLGLTPAYVGGELRNALYGAEVLRRVRGGDEVKVMVRCTRDERKSASFVREFMVRTPKGGWVPLAAVADIERGRSYVDIQRYNGGRVVEVSAEVVPRSKSEEILFALERDVLPRLCAKYPGLTYSFKGQRAEMVKSLDSLKVNYPVALFIIYAMLAVPLRSFSQPLIIMASIPFGIVGAFLGQLVMGYALSLIALFGVVALSGVVVNDSLVMMEYTNRLRRSGLDAREAVHRAAVRRFRPILLTTLTTFGGVTPMMLEQSMQARFLIPMAVSLAFGLVFATFITLVLVPVLYLVGDSLGKRLPR